MFNLFLIESNPVSVREPLVLFDVGNTILEVSVAFCQINLQLIPQKVFYVGTKVGWKSHL